LPELKSKAHWQLLLDTREGMVRLAPLLRCGATYEMESRSLALFRLTEATDNTKVKRIPARSRAALARFA
jgi:hypothetical protein